MVAARQGTARGRTPALAKYDVLEELGHGGMATVYRAHDKRLARDVAVKVLHPHLRESSEIAHRFGVEAKAVAKLRHPNIVEVFDVSSDDDEEQYLVVELVRGETLRKLLQKTGAMPPEVAAALAVEVLGALSHAHHEGVVHRDVKPENVLIEHRERPVDSGSGRTPSGSRGDRIFVKLTDFGIAKLLDAQGVTSTGQVLGSPAHMAPEQIEGGDVDGRADVFGLGVLLYECMVGHLPFEGNNPAQVLRRVLDGQYPSAEREKLTVGKRWSSILDRALAHDPNDRFVDTAQFREAILVELARLGVTSSRAELEAYFDDPETWTAEHEKSLVGKLCELGGEARKKNDAVSAAGDYNRALAYAPDDPQLLTIVARMHRAEARRRFVKKTAPIAFGVIALGLLAFFVTRAFKTPALLPDRPTEINRTDDDKKPPKNTPSADVSVAVVAPPVSVEHVLAVPKPNGSAPPRAVKRNVILATLRPPYGVHLTIDGQAAPDKEQGGTIEVDEKAHTLGFSCNGDMCEPRTVSIAAGEKDEAISVELKILPARLVVDGEPSHAYGLRELPTVTITSGVPADIPMARGTENVTIYDLSDTSKTQSAHLKAGGTTSISFKKQ